MTTYYVSKSGSDANNGLGPDASAGTNKPWLTIGKALGASGIASGDTCYVGPGVYREVVTVAMTSATAETKIIGDPANAQGFKDGSGVKLVGGEVQWTAYTTDDKTAPSTSPVLTLAGRDYLTVQYLTMVGGNNTNAACVDGSTATSTNITFTSCTMYGYTAGGSSRPTVYMGGAADVASHWLFESCVFSANGSLRCIYVVGAAPSAADVDVDILVRNCLFIGSAQEFIYFSPTTGTYKKGGLDVLNCTFLGGGDNYGALRTGSGASTSIPCTVYNSVLVLDTGLYAATDTQIVEDYNLLACRSPRTNITSTGAHSVVIYAPLVHMGQEFGQWGSTLRPFGMPTSGSPLLAFGGSSPPSTDILGAPRPSGGASALTAIGAFERGNSFAKETGTVHTGSNAISITGPGYQNFAVPVNATSTTVTCYVQWDATYAGAKPAMSVLNGEECGVTAATATATGSSGAWEQLSLNFSPTSAGIVTIRLVSSDTNGGGKMFADTFNVA